MQHPPGTGYLPSARDYRDEIVANAVAAAAPKIVLRDTLNTDLLPLGPVENQKQQLACVSNSVGLDIKRYYWRRNGTVPNLSYRFLDIMAKRFDGLGGPTTRNTTGTYGRTVLKIAAQYGCATTDTIPNDTDLSIADYRNDDLITPAVLADAAKHKIPGFIRVPNDFYAMRAAMQVHELISLGMFIGKEWWTAPDGTFSMAAKDINPLRIPAPITGGHQVLGKGWKDKDLNILRNSWGEEFGNHGEAEYNALNYAPYTMEAWAIAEVPQNIKDFLSDLPAPADFHYLFTTNMRRGDQSEDVGFLQIAYMILGYLQPITPDEFGYFGPKTEAANLAFQVASKIAPLSSRSAGPLTRSALNKVFAL